MKQTLCNLFNFQIQPKQIISQTHTVTSVTRRNLLEGNLLEGNLLERNLLERNLQERNLPKRNPLKKNLLKRKLVERNLLPRNLLKRILLKRNLPKRNLFTRNFIKRNTGRSGRDQPKGWPFHRRVQGRSPQRNPQNSMKVSQQIVKIWSLLIYPLDKPNTK